MRLLAKNTIILLLLIFFCPINIYAGIDSPKIEPSNEIPLKESNKDIISEEKKARLQQIEELSYKGIAYLNENKFDKAIEEYKKILQLDPKLAIAHTNIAWIYIQRKQGNDLELANLELKEAIRLDPKLMLAHRNLWWLYRIQDKTDEALIQLEKIIELEPDNSEQYINLGDSYLSDMKKFPLAEKTYKKAMEIESNNSYIYIKLAKALEFQKKYTNAIEVLDKAIEKFPTDCYPYLFLAIIYGKSGKSKQIMEKMKIGLNHLQKNPMTAYQNKWSIKLLKFYAGELQEKELLAESSTNPMWETQAFYYIGMKYLWEHSKNEATDFLKKCIEKKMIRSCEFEYAKIELSLN